MSTPSTPLKSTNLSSLKVVELRAELTTRNLSLKGVKKDLVKRLQDAINEENGTPQDDGNTVAEEKEKEEEEEEEEEEGDQEEEEEEDEDEVEGKGSNKNTPAKKTPKRNASSGLEPRRSSGRKGTNHQSRPSPLSKVLETPTRTSSRRAAELEVAVTPSNRASRGKRDQVVEDEEEKVENAEEQENGETKEAQVEEKKDDAVEEENVEEKHEAVVEEKGDAEMEEKKDAAVEEENVEEKHEAVVEEKGDAADEEPNVEEKGDAEMEEKSVPEESVQVTDAKTNDAVESHRKRTRSSDDEAEKQVEEITVTLPGYDESETVTETKETAQKSPQKEDKSRAQDATKDLPGRTTKRRRKEGEEADVDHDMEKNNEKGDEHVEQRSPETEIPKTKTPVSSPQKVKRIYSPIKAPTVPEPETKVPEILEETAIESPRCDPSPCIYINGLHRPLTVVMLKKKLGEYGDVEKIWLDRIKTRCYALFSDKAAAVSARTEMNDTVWPPNTGRTLTVEYLPTHRYDELVAEEEKAMETGTKLFLTPDSNPEIAARLVEVIGFTLPPSSSSSAAFTTPAPSTSSGLPPASSGRQGSGSLRLETKIRDAPIARRTSVPASSSAPSASSPATSAKLIPLDTLFRKTNAKPHLYYLPLTDEQVSEKKVRVGSGDRRRN